MACDVSDEQGTNDETAYVPHVGERVLFSDGLVDGDVVPGMVFESGTHDGLCSIAVCEPVNGRRIYSFYDDVPVSDIVRPCRADVAEPDGQPRTDGADATA